MCQNVRDYYFAGIRLSSPAIPMSEKWKQFENKLPYRFSMRLFLAEERLPAALYAPKTFGRANVIRVEDGWIFCIKDPEFLKWKIPPKEELLARVNAGLPIVPKPEDSTEEQKEDFCGMKVSEDYTDCVYYSDGDRKDMLAMFHTAVDAALPLHGGSIIHASCVAYKGKAILFCGPSGMGKSTQAMLWEERFGTHMISSDAPAVYPDPEHGAAAYGMPWDGSDQIFTQESAPIAAVVELEQAKENSIRPMSAREAYDRLLKQGHLPLWDEKAMFCEMEVLKKISTAVPFWHLACLPNTEAAELTERTIFGS